METDSPKTDERVEITARKYDPADWLECRVPKYKPGYWENLNDGSERIRIWKQTGESHGEGVWTIDLPLNHPRRILRANLRTPFFCQVCNEGMRDYHQDAEAYRRYGCCHWCVIDFVEGFVQEWDDGWRPEKEALVKAKSKRPKTV